MKELEDILIRKHTLLNAIEYGGKANAQAVLGKVVAEGSAKEIAANPELAKAYLGY